MFTDFIIRGFGFGESGQVDVQRVEVQGGLRVDVSEAIPGSSTNLLVAFAADVSQLKDFYLVADGALVVKTNNSGSPANTFTLAANAPVLWVHGDAQLRDTTPANVTTDITALYVTNAGEDPVNLRVHALLDPTV